MLAFSHLRRRSPWQPNRATTCINPAAFIPRLTRRHALLGAAALLAPIPRLVVAAAPSAAADKSGLIKLDGNENPYGPSPTARQAILASAGEAPRYADAQMESLKTQLAAHEGVATSQIVLGTGSGELLKISGILAMMGGVGGELVASRPTYEELPHFAEKLGLKLVWVAPTADHRHDLPAMRAGDHGVHAPRLRLQSQQPDWNGRQT